jgi:hypothetical protein
MRLAWALVVACAALAVAVPRAAAQAPDVPLTFTTRSVLGGEGFTVAGVLPGGAADAGRIVQLQTRRAPFAGNPAYAVAQQAAAGPGGEFSFSVVPDRKAYWGVSAPATSTSGRVVSRGFLVGVRRKVSIRTSTRRPRRGRLVRFSGFIAPALPSGPSVVATLQRRKRDGGYANVRPVLAKPAGAFSSYRLRVRVRRSGTYRVVVPGSTFYSQGASVAVVVRVRR